MALVVEQKTRVSRFNENFGLNLGSSVKELHSNKGEQTTNLYFHGELHRCVAVAKNLEKNYFNYSELDNSVMATTKRSFLSFIFTCLCSYKPLLICFIKYRKFKRTTLRAISIP